MAKAKKPRSEKQLANDQRLRDEAAAAKTKTPTEVTLEKVPVEQPDITPGQTISKDDYEDLLRRIEELKTNQFSELIAAIRGGQATDTQVANGKLTGTFVKYVLSADKYPSPVARLMLEAKLARFAFDINYELDYEVGISEYETIDHVRTREPKFALTLIRVLMDEETGEPTNGRYEVCRLVMHEDPEAAMVIARDNGLEVDQEDEELFLNEMRFIRMRDWLLECFYPAPIKKESTRREVVIGGKLVTYYEKGSEDGKGLSKTDWDNAPKIRF